MRRTRRQATARVAAAHSTARCASPAGRAAAARGSRAAAAPARRSHTRPPALRHASPRREGCSHRRARAAPSC
eukprot:4283140-Prymnesium_polylepis.1